MGPYSVFFLTNQTERIRHATDMKTMEEKLYTFREALDTQEKERIGALKSLAEEKRQSEGAQQELTSAQEEIAHLQMRLSRARGKGNTNNIFVGAEDQEEMRADRIRLLDKLSTASETISTLNAENRQHVQTRVDLISVLQSEHAVSLNSLLTNLRKQYSISGGLLADCSDENEQSAHAPSDKASQWELLVWDADNLQRRFARQDAERAHQIWV